MSDTISDEVALHPSVAFVHECLEATGDLPPTWAVKFSNGVEVGSQLATRDGRVCGNAVVLGIDIEGTAALMTRVWEVGTDAGNVLRLTNYEIDEMFYPPVFCMEPLYGPVLGQQAQKGRSMNKLYPYVQICVVADTNDADYVTLIKPMSQDDIETITKWTAFLKTVRGNWSTRAEYDEGELAEDVYADVFTPEEFKVISRYIPSSECGVHTIESVTLQEVHSEYRAL